MGQQARKQNKEIGGKFFFFFKKICIHFDF